MSKIAKNTKFTKYELWNLYQIKITICICLYIYVFYVFNYICIFICLIIYIFVGLNFLSIYVQITTTFTRTFTSTFTGTLYNMTAVAMRLHNGLGLVAISSSECFNVFGKEVFVEGVRERGAREGIRNGVRKGARKRYS